MTLTPRQHQIATRVRAGQSNKHIARELNISPSTAGRPLRAGLADAKASEPPARLGASRGIPVAGRAHG